MVGQYESAGACSSTASMPSACAASSRSRLLRLPQISSTGLTSDAFAEALLKEESVAVVPGTAFGEAGEGHVRCC